MYVVYNDPFPQTSMKCITLLLFLQLSNEYRIEAAMKVERHDRCFCSKTGDNIRQNCVIAFISNIITLLTNYCQIDNLHYHIFCCNMFVFACPIIAWSVGYFLSWQIFVFALKYPYLPPNLTSGICNLVSKKYVKVQGKIVESYFNQINTFQNIGIKFK